jgi:hypothetical protein
MNLSKRKYKKIEVETLLDNLSSDFNLIINKQKLEIKNLTDEKTKLTAEIELYKEKEDAINGAMLNAEQNLIDKQKDADRYYSLTVQSLKNFLTRWNSYFNALAEKYPLYSAVNSAIEVKKQLEKILLTETNDKDIVSKAEALLPKETKTTKKFNPQQKINDYIVATSDTEFNLDEVLNPGELVLEDLCKELGLIEEN